MDIENPPFYIQIRDGAPRPRPAVAERFFI
jgi:hypothetical protein